MKKAESFAAAAAAAAAAVDGQLVAMRAAIGAIEHVRKRRCPFPGLNQVPPGTNTDRAQAGSACVVLKTNQSALGTQFWNKKTENSKEK